MKERQYTLLVGKPLGFKHNDFWREFLLKHFNEKRFSMSYHMLVNPLRTEGYGTLLVHDFFSGYYPTEISKQIELLYKSMEENNDFKNLYLHTTCVPAVKYFIGHEDFNLVHVNDKSEIFMAEVGCKEDIRLKAIDLITTDFDLTDVRKEYRLPYVET